MKLKNNNDVIPYAKQEESLMLMNGQSKKLKIYPSYFLQNIPGTSRNLFLRQTVGEKIISIAEKLPADFYLVLIDGWRAYETQLFLYKRAIRLFRKLGYSQQQIKQKINGFVAYPSKSIKNPAPHYSGSAIDLTLSHNEQWLEMGTAFDDFTEKSYSDYYENRVKLSMNERTARDNRCKLRCLMEKAGFACNPTEWWHYSYGDQTWANVHHTVPLYGGIGKNI